MTGMHWYIVPGRFICDIPRKDNPNLDSSANLVVLIASFDLTLLHCLPVTSQLRPFQAISSMHQLSTDMEVCQKIGIVLELILS